MNEWSGACSSDESKHINRVNKTLAQEGTKDWKHGDEGKVWMGPSAHVSPYLA